VDFNTYEFIKENIDNITIHNYDSFRFIDSPGYNYEECFESYAKRIVNFIIARVIYKNYFFIIFSLFSYFVSSFKS